MIASYQGDAVFAASDSARQAVNVSKATPKVILTPSTVFAGPKPRSLTVKVSVVPGIAGGPIPTGSVTFTINQRKGQTVRLVHGTASLVVSSSQLAGRTLVAQYLGATNYRSALSNAVHFGSGIFKGKLPVIGQSPAIPL
jgi:hypothetical protein